MGQAFWNVPHPRNPSFTGREAEIAGLRECLARKRKTALAQAISGLGGIGKTQTAVEYAYRYRDKYKAVLWLNAESPLSLNTGCGDIARQMPLPHDEKDLDQAAAAVKDWLGTHRDWLLILDNADDPAVLEPFLPTDHEGHILITSRAQDFQHLGILAPVELGELPIEDATAFLLRRCGREGADEAERGAARELAGELDGLPLALEQAAAYIVATRGATFQRVSRELPHGRPGSARSAPAGPWAIPQVGCHHLGRQFRGGAGGLRSRCRRLAAQCLPGPRRDPF